jgi:hypothetical protein
VVYLGTDDRVVTGRSMRGDASSKFQKAEPFSFLGIPA